MVGLSTQGRSTLLRALEAAGRSTEAEIHIGFARSASAYRDIGAIWAAGCALLLPMLLIPMGFDAAWLPGVGDTWAAAHLAAQDIVLSRSLAAFVVLQTAVFVGVFLIALWPPVRLHLTPRRIRRARARALAIQCLKSRGFGRASGRTGLLILAVLDERQIEVVADADIQLALGEDILVQIVERLVDAARQDRLVEGLTIVIDGLGRILSTVRPVGPTPAVGTVFEL